MLSGQLPARLNVEQTAWLLNCQPHDVPVLVAARLLKPLGNPPPNAVKFFGSAEVLELTRERTWLAKITNAVNQHWRESTSRRKGRPCRNAQNGQPLIGAGLQPLANAAVN